MNYNRDYKFQSRPHSGSALQQGAAYFYSMRRRQRMGLHRVRDLNSSKNVPFAFFLTVTPILPQFCTDFASSSPFLRAATDLRPAPPLRPPRHFYSLLQIFPKNPIFTSSSLLWVSLDFSPASPPPPTSENSGHAVL